MALHGPELDVRLESNRIIDAEDDGDSRLAQSEFLERNCRCGGDDETVGAKGRTAFLDDLPRHVANRQLSDDDHIYRPFGRDRVRDAAHLLGREDGVRIA